MHCKYITFSVVIVVAVNHDIYIRLNKLTFAHLVVECRFVLSVAGIVYLWLFSTSGQKD